MKRPGRYHNLHFAYEGHEDVRGEMTYPRSRQGTASQLYLYSILLPCWVKVGAGRPRLLPCLSCPENSLSCGHFSPLQALLMESSYSFAPHTSLTEGCHSGVWRWHPPVSPLLLLGHPSVKAHVFQKPNMYLITVVYR